MLLTLLAYVYSPRCVYTSSIGINYCCLIGLCVASYPKANIRGALRSSKPSFSLLSKQLWLLFPKNWKRYPSQTKNSRFCIKLPSFRETPKSSGIRSWRFCWREETPLQRLYRGHFTSYLTILRLGTSCGVMFCRKSGQTQCQHTKTSRT